MASTVINAQTDIAATPEVQVPIETPVVEETPKIETPAPGTTPTATPDDPATPAAVTSLPNTSSGEMSTAPFAIFGGLAAALMLLGTGLVLRVRGSRS